jgi:AcrR family transcriptional regulator
VGKTLNPAKAKLLAATADIVREGGLAAVSARTIAARAQVSQALVFYHFDTVAALLEASCRQAVDDSVGSYREELASVSSMASLLTLGRVIHERELASGNVVMMAQLMAGAQTDPTLAGIAGYAMNTWNQVLTPVVQRIFAGHPLADLLDPAGLTRLISAGFIGLELYERVAPEDAELAQVTLQALAVLAEVVDGLGVVARSAVNAKLRSARRKGTVPARRT